MREEVLKQFEKDIIERGVPDALAKEIAWAARFEYQAFRYRQAAELAERLEKTPVDVYVCVLSGRFPWVSSAFGLEEAALGALLPHIPQNIREALALDVLWNIEGDALCITLTNKPLSDKVEIYPTVEDGDPYIRMFANGKWCGDRKIPAAGDVRQMIRHEVMAAIGRAVIQRKTIPEGEEIKRLLDALSTEATEK